MAVEPTIYAKSIVFNAVTYDNTTGGLIGANFTHSGTPILHRIADNEYATSVFIVDKEVRITMSAAEVNINIAIGTKSNLVLTLSGKGADKVLTFSNMVYAGIDADQQRATPGNGDHTFVHESTDGTTDPVV